MAKPPPRPRAGYYYAHVDQAARREVLENVADRLAERYEITMEKLMEAFGLERGPPAVRLAFYTRKPPEDWEGQQFTYPRDYAEDFSDFERLKARYEEDPDFRGQVDVILATLAAEDAAAAEQAQANPAEGVVT